MLGIKANWNINDITKDVNAEIEAYLNEVVETYSKAGVAMVDDARSRTKAAGDSFGNITWELRSSIGCVVYRGGAKVMAYFPVLNTGAKGAKDGEDYADFIASQIIDFGEIVLVVVAGKEYAYAVESRGLNVISSTAKGAEKILERYINEN